MFLMKLREIESFGRSRRQACRLTAGVKDDWMGCGDRWIYYTMGLLPVQGFGHLLSGLWWLLCAFQPEEALVFVVFGSTNTPQITAFTLIGMGCLYQVKDVFCLFVMIAFITVFYHSWFIWWRGTKLKKVSAIYMVYTPTLARGTDRRSLAWSASKKRNIKAGLHWSYSHA